ncbi:sensor histidine kinase [Bdellovibrio sp. HCB209]|uniref:sensor histidine kinase n=1 Tax=Bdellovibrio sp. HCB209 TaxID=3394354 RepID=UPI0039B46735
MTQLSQMKFSKKIFLTIFGTGVVTTLAICLILNFTISKRLYAEFEDSYVDHMNLLSKTLALLEKDKEQPELNELFNEMINHDVDNLSVKLVNGGGEILGHFHRQSFTDAVDLKSVLANPDGAQWHDGRMLVLTSLKYKEGANYYLVATISTSTIDKEIGDIHLILIVAGIVLIVLSLWLSQVLTKTLLRKVSSIYSTLDEISKTQDYSKRVSVVANSQDELDGLGQNLNHMLETLQANQGRLLEAERDQARSQVAAQVAHDIRSPLMSMNMALAQIETAQMEPMAILKSAIARVAGIVQKLSASSVKSEESTGVENPRLTLVEPLVASVVSEQNVRRSAEQVLKLKGLTSQPQIWSVVQVHEFQTVISNLVNNAFEAGASKVDLEFSSAGKKWTLAIKDNGSGIPDEVLARMYERGFTSGKATGSGLGLFHAKSVVEWNGGTLNVQTAVGQGTVFTIEMPKEKNPPWLPLDIELSKEQVLVFVDDDQNVLKAWKDKAVSQGVQNAYFYSTLAELKNSPVFKDLVETGLLVVDQNLSETKKGLEFLAEVGMGRRAYLCTTDFDEKPVQDQVRSVNAYMIPKPWITLFELKVRT